MLLAWCLVHMTYFSGMKSFYYFFICHQCKAGKFWKLIVVSYVWIYICICLLFCLERRLKNPLWVHPDFSFLHWVLFLVVSDIVDYAEYFFLSLLHSFIFLVSYCFWDKSASSYRCFFQFYMPSIDVQTLSSSRFFPCFPPLFFGLLCIY